MDKVTFFEVESMGDKETHALIDHGNDQFTSMPKAEYDRRQAEQFTLGLVNTNKPAEPVI